MKLADCSSMCLDIACGVPQGSVLKLVLFADDKIYNYYVYLFISCDDLHQLVEVINLEMNKLQWWFNINKLSFDWACLNVIWKLQNKGTNKDTEWWDKHWKFPWFNNWWKTELEITYNIHSKVQISIAVSYKAKQVLDHKSLTLTLTSIVHWFHLI